MTSKIRTGSVACGKRFCITAAVATLVGCGDLLYYLGQPVTRIVLKNNSDYRVDITMYFSSRQDISEAELKSLGEKREYSLSDGETVVFVRDCVTLQAMIISEAKLRVVGSDGPDDETDVLRAGTDFGCRSSVEFTFDHSDVVFDFHVETSVKNDPYNPGGAP